MIGYLRGEDAQIFIDIMDEVWLLTRLSPSHGLIVPFLPPVVPLSVTIR